MNSAAIHGMNTTPARAHRVGQAGECPAPLTRNNPGSVGVGTSRSLRRPGYLPGVTAHLPNHSLTPQGAACEVSSSAPGARSEVIA